MSPIENVVPDLVEIPTQPNSTKQYRSRDIFGVQLEVNRFKISENNFTFSMNLYTSFNVYSLQHTLLY